MSREVEIHKTSLEVPKILMVPSKGKQGKRILETIIQDDILKSKI